MSADNNVDARIAAARAIGLFDSMADEIQIIDGVPEWRPDGKDNLPVEDRNADLIRYDGSE